MKKNYGTIPNTMKLSFTVEKKYGIWKILWYYGKKLRFYGKTIVL